MDRRTFLALLLSALVIVVTPIVFRGFGGRQLPPPPAPRDTTSPVAAPTATAQTTLASPQPATPTPVASVPTAAPRLAADTASVDAAKTRYVFSTAGAAPQSIQLGSYANLSATQRVRARATLAASAPNQPPLPLLRYRVVRSSDTLALDTVAFRAQRDGNGITFTSGGTPAVTLRYQFADDGYVAHVTGEITSTAGAPVPAQLLVDLPTTLRSQEPDTLDDER